MSESNLLFYQGDKKLYIRSFFADNDFNQNKWRVTQDALNRDIASGVEKDYFGKTAPMIDTPQDGHPPDETEDMITEQEQYRKGDFIRTGIDSKSKRAFVDAVIYDAETIKRIQNGELNYVSPSIRALEEIHSGSTITVPRFKINHLAFVKKPAYGELKAQIRGRCSGTEEECLPVLANIQAEAKVGVMPCGGIQINISAESVPDYIKEKIKNKGVITINDVDDMMNKNAEGKYICKNCGYKSEDSNILQEHFDKTGHKFSYDKNAVENYNCPECGDDFDTKTELENHYKKDHPEKFEGEDSSEQINQTKDYGADYATTNRGEHKLVIGSPQDILLHTRKLSHSHVHIDSEGKKYIKRYDAEVYEEDHEELQANECTSKWIPELKKSHPEWEMKQVEAVAFAKCREGEHKSSSIKALKGKNGNNYSMTPEEEQKKIDEEKKKKEQEDKVASLENSNKELKAELSTFKAVLDAEVKSPIVNKIVQARLKAGSLKEADKQAATDALMKNEISYLKTMENDYSAMIKHAEVISKTQSQPSQTRFSYSASIPEAKEEVKRVLSHIRSRS